jgi:hypothetical protein
MHGTACMKVYVSMYEGIGMCVLSSAGNCLYDGTLVDVWPKQCMELHSMYERCAKYVFVH